MTDRLNLAMNYFKGIYKTSWLQYVKGDGKNKTLSRFSDAIKDRMIAQKAESDLMAKIEEQKNAERAAAENRSIFARMLG